MARGRTQLQLWGKDLEELTRGQDRGRDPEQQRRERPRSGKPSREGLGRVGTLRRGLDGETRKGKHIWRWRGRGALSESRKRKIKMPQWILGGGQQ